MKFSLKDSARKEEIYAQILMYHHRSIWMILATNRGDVHGKHYGDAVVSDNRIDLTLRTDVKSAPGITTVLDALGSVSPFSKPGWLVIWTVW